MANLYVIRRIKVQTEQTADMLLSLIKNGFGLKFKHPLYRSAPKRPYATTIVGYEVRWVEYQ